MQFLVKIKVGLILAARLWLKCWLATWKRCEQDNLLFSSQWKSSINDM